MIYKKDVWLSMRGAEMLMLMKLISLSVDIEQKNVRFIGKRMQFIDFLNYLLAFDAVIFGPWISYDDFLLSIKSRKTIPV